MAIALSAESTIDMDEEHLAKYGISILHFHVQKGDVSGFDNAFTNEELFAWTLQSGVLAHTSACNIEEFRAHFALLFHQGFDEIIHFTISSELSSGYSNAVVAAAGDPRIHVVDSKVTSGGIALQAIYARELIAAGYSCSEVLIRILARRAFVQCSFQLDRLDFLYKGGRCSKLSLIGANLLQIKPEILCDSNGRFALGKKWRGSTQKCDEEYMDDMVASYPNIDNKLCFVNKSTCDPLLMKELIARAKGYGFQEVLSFQASPTNAYHSGPNVIGIHFYADGPHPIPEQTAAW